MKRLFFTIAALAAATLSFAQEYLILNTSNGLERHDITTIKEAYFKTYSATGSGTEADPFNVAGANIKAREAPMGISAEKYYIKGLFGSQNATGTSISIADDMTGTNRLTVQLGQPYTQLNKGDEVLVCASLHNTYAVYPGYAVYLGEIVTINGVSLAEAAAADLAFDFKTEGSLGWTTYDVLKPSQLENVWTYNSKYGMVATAYLSSGTNNYASESWLISPQLDLSGKESAFITLNHAGNYFTNISNECSVLISENYVAGSDVNNATWEKLTFSSWPTNFTFVDSPINICKYAGKKVNLAFKYTSAETKAGTWEIASVAITENNPVSMPEGLTHAGTAEDPFNIADAMKVIAHFGESGTPEEVYVQGVFAGLNESDAFNSLYGNLSYYISEDGSENGKLYVYRGWNLGGEKFKANTDLKAGDRVIVVGKLVNFKGNNPQFNTGSKLYMLNDEKAPDGGQSGGEGGGEGGGGGQAGGEAVTSMTNGDFETWAEGQPTGWKSVSSASSATLEQSTDKHGGNYAVLVKGGGSANKRLASQEITLAAGSYNFSFWVKATSQNKAQVRAGYVPVTNGSAGTYTYKTDYDNISTTWSQVSYDFTLATETTICLVVMNPKSGSYSSGEDVIVDDATLTKK